MLQMNGGPVPQSVQQNKGASVPPVQGQPQPGKVDPATLDYFRNGDQELKQAIEMFVGHPVDMNSIPEDLLVAVAGMVQKLGVSGAVAMAKKTLPPQVQQQLKAAQ